MKAVKRLLTALAYNYVVNTKYGLRGTITPGERFKGTEESFAYDGFELEIKDGVIAIGFNDKADADRAREIVHQHLAWYSMSRRIRHTVDLNQSWELKSDHTKTVAINVGDRIKITDDIRVTQATIQGKARIVSATYDSAALSSYSSFVRKTQHSSALAKAVTYFGEEVVDDDRPLYGVYKALEELSHAVGGRDKLARLVGRPKKFVEDVMETTQLTRHARTFARQLLSEDECRERARILIEAYANSVV